MDQMTQEPVAVARPGPALALRIGIVGVAAAALVAVGILAAGATAILTNLLAANDGTAGVQVSDQSGWHEGLGRRGGPGGSAFGGITITAINGSSLSLETVDGWTRTITVDADTDYYHSGDAIALSDLRVGDEIRFRQTLEDDGTWTIEAIAVIPPHVGGQVTAVSGTSITVERRDGSTATVTVTGDTEFVVNGDDDATIADVEVDMFLAAIGTQNADGSLTATHVRAAERGELGGFGGRHGPGSRGFGWDEGDAG